MDRKEQGFSLVEMIVSMAILSIVGAAMLSLFIYCLNQYTRSSDEVNLQYESQLCMNRVSGQILAATEGISAASDGICLYGDSDAGQMTAVRLYLPSDGKGRLMYQEYKQQPDGTWTAAGDAECFASYVETIAMTVYDADGNPVPAAHGSEPLLTDTAGRHPKKPVRVEVRATFRVGERTYETQNVVALRNEMAAYYD